MNPGGLHTLDAAVEAVQADWVCVDQALIDRTLARAARAPRGRARVLLHGDPGAALHEMLIALPAHSCDVPHINDRSAKSFHVLRGEVALMRFDAQGTQVTPWRLGAPPGAGVCHIRLEQPCWHTLIPLGGPVVFIETILGPFTGNRFAPWAPQPAQGPRWDAFVAGLRQAAQGESGRPQAWVTP